MAALARLDYTKDFLIFLFASEHTMDVLLLKKNEEGHEKPISLFSNALRDNGPKYNILEKQAFALVRALKYFREYIINSKIFESVPHPVVKDILIQQYCDGRRGKWIANIQEYDMEIHPEFGQGERVS